MPHGRYLVAPILVFNLAGEMLYILNQRLKAQNVAADKASKVLADISGAIYKQEFVKELMRPQRSLPISFLKDLFQQLVHTSIMKLNETSMAKLYDLMLMCFKMQVFLAASSTEVYTITLNHLREVAKIIQKGLAFANIEQTISIFRERYEALPAARYVEIKEELLKLLDECRVRISILLQEQLQNQDGTLVHYQRWACYLAQPIGTVELPLKGTFTKEKLGPYDQDWKPRKGKDFRDWQSELGLNVYEGYLPVKNASVTSQPSSMNKSVIENKSGAAAESKVSVDRTLSSLILGSRSKQKEEECFVLDLFESKTSGGYKPGAGQSIDTAILQRPKADNSFKQAILRDLQMPPPQPEEEEDDLLSMMDKASK